MSCGCTYGTTLFSFCWMYWTIVTQHALPLPLVQTKRSCLTPFVIFTSLIVTVAIAIAAIVVVAAIVAVVGVGVVVAVVVVAT